MKANINLNGEDGVEESSIEELLNRLLFPVDYQGKTIVFQIQNANINVSSPGNIIGKSIRYGE